MVNEKTILPWIAVNEMMDDVYREKIISDALEYYSLASPDLRRFALKILKKTIKPDGFRSFIKAPVRITKPIAVNEMQSSNDVATAIICLWAEKQDAIIKELADAARETGTQFDKEWSWQKAQAGFIALDDIQELYQLAGTISKDKTKTEKDHYLLAALWLSNGITTQNDSQVKIPLETNTMETEKVTENTIENNLAPPRDTFPKQGVVLETSDANEFTSADTDTLEKMSLDELFVYWEEQSDNTEKFRSKALSQIDKLKTATSTEVPKVIRKKLDDFDENLSKWEENYSSLGELLLSLREKFSYEFQLRPGIEENPLSVSAFLDVENDLSLEEKTSAIPEIFSLIKEYDQKRKKLLSELENLRPKLRLIEESLELWYENTSLFEKTLPLLENAEDLSIADIQNHIDNIKQMHNEGKERVEQARELSISRIIDTLSNIEQISGENVDEIGKLDERGNTSKKLRELDDKKLQSRETQILNKYNQLLEDQSSEGSQELATQLKAEWSDKVYVDLLKELASENKNIEVLLLELATNTAKPRSTKLEFESHIVKSMFSGVSEISPNNPFLFINQLARPFFTGWLAKEKLARVEKCILALAVNASSNHNLPEGFLWDIEAEWPAPEMKNWKKVWETLLLSGGEIEVFTDKKQLEAQITLEKKYSDVHKLFTKDGGHYLKLAGMKSTRHRKMMTDSVMPKFQKHFNDLQKIKEEIESANERQKHGLLNKLEKNINELTSFFEPKELDDVYDAAVYAHEINDVSFHEKVCKRIISDLSEKILSYGEWVLKNGNIRLARQEGVVYQNLLAELKTHTEINPIVIPALEKISQESIPKYVPSDNDDEHKQGEDKIVSRLLSTSSYITRFPKTISLLINHPFGWEEIRRALISDIASPKDIPSATKILLDENVTSQVRLIVEQLSLENQKRVQSLHHTLERKTIDLENTFIELGGENKAITLALKLGRWGYLSEFLAREIDTLQKKSTEEHQTYLEHSFSFRSRINNLDDKCFKEKAEIPIDIYPALKEALEVARQVSEEINLFPQLEKHLEEIEYRLNRKAWDNNTGKDEITESTLELKKLLSGNTTEEQDDYAIKDILDAFDTKTQQDKPFATTIEESKKETRANILYSWEKTKKTKSFLKKDMNQMDENNIRELFSYFARMISMDRVRKNIVPFVPPDFIYELWKLRYPRTVALKKTCVLIALPGDSPSKDDIQELEEFLERDNTLASHFVFLFIPGDSTRVTKRLDSKRKQGLVLINETALKKILLAEIEHNFTPLDKLRPMMLNAIQGNADIFTVNQSVNSRTSIFVGRDSLIDRIATSGDNYAIYGGRRIGKSSVIKAIENRLKHRNQKVISTSLEGEDKYTEEHISKILAHRMGLQYELGKTFDLKTALFNYFEENPDKSIVLILDEIDRYIAENPKRHILIETLRATSERFEDRFRVIIAGFMNLYDCLENRGPYSPSSNPWGRMLNADAPLGNLKPSSAEKIVKVGFRSILGWEFSHRTIPRKIVEKTGGHPAFVQHFCMKLQERVNNRGDQIINMEDVDAVYSDDDPTNSFIAYVNDTLAMNFVDHLYLDGTFGNEIENDLIESVPRYLLAYLATLYGKSQSFTFDQIVEIANSSEPPIPESIFARSLNLLKVTSVIREKSTHLYEFTVPDYPDILNRLGESHLNSIEGNLKKFLKKVL